MIPETGELVKCEHMGVGPLKSVLRFDSKKYERDLDTAAWTIYQSNLNDYNECKKDLASIVGLSNCKVIDKDSNVVMNEIKENLR